METQNDYWGSDYYRLYQNKIYGLKTKKGQIM